MKTSKLSLIITREFLIRVKKRSFIIMTILTPIFIAALVVLPSVIMTLSSGKRDQTILVIDRSELCEPFFKSSEEFNYKFDPAADVISLKKDFPSNLFAIVEISAPDSLLNVSVSAHSPKQLNMDAKNQIERFVQKAMEDSKLKKYNIENLDQILKDVRSEVSVKTFTITEEGDEKLGMVEIYMAISYLLSFFIYMFIFMFGSMVMR
ncbi:MAG: ABC transporter permease, partial [Bacteroidales bacterium]|nr:ABC transporter permease [Bacteroidales bacterium]